MRARSVVIQTAQDEVNVPFYRRSDLVGAYASATLDPPEVMVLVKYREDILHQPVLDLGCGAGRLAVFLRPLTDQYMGLDISPHMVGFCRRHFPDLQFRQGDMREPAIFEPCSFAAVFAVFNLFDAVSHEERQRVLAEVHRLLRANGLLVFSSHNRNYSQARTGPKLAYSRNPFTMLRHVTEFFEARANRRRIKRLERSEPEYALWNDCAHNFALLHYYISREAQARQLDAAGFDLLECLDEQGRTLQPMDADQANSSILYVARQRVPNRSVA
jgi:SAM-dependent methyltransferase